MNHNNVNPQQRLPLLELLLIWEGRLNRSRVCEIFGVGQVRASQWIRELRDLHPDWMVWDSKSRSYYATTFSYKSYSGASQAQISGSLSRYLSITGLPYASAEDGVDVVAWSATPSISAPPPKLFATLGQAIKQKRSVEIVYMSMREPAPHRRVVSPHSLVRAGRRWHVRAYSQHNQDFRDYALGRVLEVKPLAFDAERFKADDLAWNTNVCVRLIAHPGLSPEQAKVIQFEYFNGTSSRVETSRAALVPYFIQDVRAAMDTETQRVPDYQIAVENTQEVAPWVFGR